MAQSEYCRKLKPQLTKGDDMATADTRDVPGGTATADLDVVIPAYNESTRLPETLRETVRFLADVPWRSRVIVVDNGSVDGTAAAAAQAALEVGPVGSRVVVDVIGCSRPGKGAAVRRGILAGRAPLVGFFDADLATPLDTLPTAIAALRGGAAAAIASRHVPGASFVETQPLTRRLGGQVFRTLSGALVSGIADTQCGFKFFQRPAVTAALVRTRTTGFAFDVEMLHRIQRDGGEIVELPVAWTDRAGSTFHPVRDGIASYKAVLALHGGAR
jgi:dolichyl-phosphate beta-glucosyltransferase